MKFQVPEPCSERWETMERRPDGRFCQKCQHTVIDLSRLTRREAEKKVAAVKGDYVCVQLAMGEDGAQFRPEAKRAAKWAGGLVLAAALSAGCAPEESAVVVDEPCALEPMTPLPPEAIAVSQPVGEPTEVIVPQSGTQRPTQMQIDLTAQKHRPVMVRGRMPMRH